MAAGRRNHRVEIQRDMQGEPTEFGTIPERWVTRDWRWAHIESAPGPETPTGAQMTGSVTHKIEMLYWEDKDGLRLSPKFRIRFGERLFNIVAVANHGEQGGTTMIELAVVERV